MTNREPPDFSSNRDQYVAYSEAGSATQVLMPDLRQALPGPLYICIPPLPDIYRPRPNDLDAIKALLLKTGGNTGIVGQARSAGLRGMGGLGKTTLAKAVVHDPDVKACFKYGIIWLSCGRRATALSQLTALGRAISGQPPAYQNIAEARADISRLVADKKLLVVLDDVWEPSLADAFRDLTPSGTLLVTSRKQSVLDAARCKTYPVGVLRPPEDRALLAECLGVAALPPQADDILRECGGSPLALKSAAAIIARGGAQGWQRVHQAFTQARLEVFRTSHETDPEQTNLDVILAASVLDLPEREQKCFYACAIWPEDAAVDRASLPLFWSEIEPDSFLHQDIADSLLGASVLEPGPADTLQLHDHYADWLAHHCRDSLSARHSGLVNRCLSVTPDECTLLADDPWVWRYLPFHLAEAGRASDYRRLLLNAEWLIGKLSRLGVQAVIEDCSLVHDAETALLGRALRLSTHVLAADPDQLSAQLIGRLGASDASDTSRLIGRLRAAAPPTALLPAQPKFLAGPGALQQTLAGHTGRVNGAVLLPDGARALSWSRDNTLRLWTLATGESQELRGHTGWVDGAVLLPDGARALSWSYDNTLRLWTLATGESQELRGHTNGINGAVLLPDGARALSWSDDNTLRLWTLATGESQELRGHTYGVRGAVLLPDGARALSWSRDNTLRLWTLATGESQELRGHPDGVLGTVLLPDGARALSWSYDNTLRLWTLATGESQELRGHTDWVLGAVLLPDGARALSWSQDNTLRLWTLATGESQELRGHTYRVRGAVLLPDGARALSWSDDNTLRLWTLATGESQELRGHTGWVRGGVLLPDGARALSWSDDNTLRLWTLATASPLAAFYNDWPITCANLVADASVLIGDGGGRILTVPLSRHAAS